MVKTHTAWNEHGKPYTAEQINDVGIYAEMKAVGVYDELKRPVTPVMRTAEESSHFRLCSVDKSTTTRRKESDPHHDNVVVSLHEFLSAAEANLTVSTKDWGNSKWVKKGDGQVEVPGETQIWSHRKNTAYKWHREPDTRHWISSKEYILPDIVGRDELTFSRTSDNVGIIVEVVYEHWPDEQSWAELLRLSTVNYLVLFYFVKPSADVNRENGYNSDSSELLISVYLKAGELFITGRKYAGADLGSTQGYREAEKRVELNVASRIKRQA
ncbi:hypothetical protein [Xanthomonas cerealis]|uniref:hypothetical protein n=1 Tax=Xanthomonas cerealis TaxID=3390025 RepID=UPI00057999E1|nr:hypothetical protein [Xanthomonas translucens]UKE46214.1 hypothetical protein KHA79_13905 [Xanthomonas translucens pv. cerealis]